MTVLPFGRLSGRHGTCGLCGFVGKLSKTHIPARASGNTSPSRAAVERIDASGVPLIGLGRPRDGGLFGWWFCEACNGRTGQWDEEYVSWASPLVLALQEGKHRARRPLACAIETGDPGAFVRALWGWMFAIDDKLRAEQPALAQSVLSGEPVEAPTAVRLLLGATTSLRVWLRGQRDHVSVTTRLATSEGRTHPSGLWTPTPEVVRLPRAVVCAPPYVAILAAATDDPVAP